MATTPSPQNNDQAALAACGACAAVDVAGAAGQGGIGGETLMLSLPEIYCAACISGVEAYLLDQPGVAKARVNLTLKRAVIDAVPGTDPAQLAAGLTAIGFSAAELDPGAVAGEGLDPRGRALLARLGVAGFAMMNVMLLSVAVWSGASDATRDMFHWISALIALPTIAFCGTVFFSSALGALRHGRLNMDVPISLAIILAAGISVYETGLGGERAYFDAAVSLLFFLLAGRYLEHRTRAAARSAAQELVGLEVARAQLADGRVVAVGDLAIGDVVRMAPGTRLPTDGTVLRGRSELDCSFLTGETLPQVCGEGDLVSAGAMNLTGPLDIRVDARAKDSSLMRLAELVAIAETARNRYTSLADRAAQIYAPLVHILAFGAFIAWYVGTGDLRHAINIAVATLIITCPCALGLAVPAVSAAASGRLYKQGLLLKSPTALERLAEVDVVVFDKTGTLTMGQPELTNTAEIDADVMATALAIARGSAHPLAQGLVRAAGPNRPAAEVTDAREVPGYGIEGRLTSGPKSGAMVRLGRADWVGAEPRDQTATYLQIGALPPVAFTFRDALRPGAAELVRDLQARGVAVHLLSGDTAAAVQICADTLGIQQAKSGLRPDQKAEVITDLAARGHRVLMVGDGLNDTGALAAAHVSISPASALEAARVVSDIVMLGQSLAPISGALGMARSATRRIKENFAIAAVYNTISIPLAVMGLASPLAAALAMSTSSILVSLNALRLAGHTKSAPMIKTQPAPRASFDRTNKTLEIT